MQITTHHCSWVTNNCLNNYPCGSDWLPASSHLHSLLSDVDKRQLHHHSHDAQKRPVWGELTCVAQPWRSTSYKYYFTWIYIHSIVLIVLIITTLLQADMVRRAWHTVEHARTRMWHRLCTLSHKYVAHFKDMCSQRGSTLLLHAHARM